MEIFNFGKGFCVGSFLGLKLTELVYRGVWVVNRMTLGIYKNTPNYLLPL